MSQNKEPEPTRLESAEDIIRALEARKARPPSAVPVKPPAPGKPPLATPVLQGDPDEPQRERPFQRPPMAFLCILDDGPLDGKLDGEWLRLRADRTTIGRSAGDVCVPHDVLMSGQHAEIVREQGPAGWRWLLRDLESRNGTFVRIGSTILRHENEVIVGKGHYRFESASPAGGITTAHAATGGMTQQPQPLAGGLRALMPSLVEITPAVG